MAQSPALDVRRAVWEDGRCRRRRHFSLQALLALCPPEIWPTSHAQLDMGQQHAFWLQNKAPE